jgi:hypothetical protein
MARKSKADQHTRAAALLAGVRKHFEPKKAYVVAGTRYTGRQLVDVLEQHLRALAAVRAARAVLAEAVAEERRRGGPAAALARSLKRWVEGHFGADPALHADFGLALPKKRGPKTVEAKLRGVQKRAAKAAKAAKR